jgi:hypothetical protein
VQFEGPHMRVSSNKILQKYGVCPTFYTWRFSLGCAAHDANHDA